MENLSDRHFLQILETAFGKEITEKVISGLNQPASVSVRSNPSKMKEGHWSGGETVPWSAYGRILSERPVFTLDPFFHAGCYYVQDSSAMFVGEVFRKTLDGFSSLGRNIRVLDLCAAPGGKTTDLAASLRGRFGENFLLVSNEVMRQRCSVLCDNVSLWGDPCVVVTSLDPKAFAQMEGFFDIIVADVPCSGEGMFRKDQQALAEWSLDAVDLCAARQKRILADVWPSLRKGGVMVYSTCTFNLGENDDNVQWILDELSAESILQDMDYQGVIKTRLGYSLVPGLVRGEGQYCSAVRKTSGKDFFRMPSSKGSKVQVSSLKFPWLFTSEMTFRQKESVVIAYPEVIGEEIQAISALRPVHTGVTVGMLKGKDLVPDADLALCIDLNQEAYPSADLDLKMALSFLHKDTIILKDAPKGFVKVQYQGHPIGFVKNLGQRCNNLHPASRRIRMDIDN